MQKLGPPSTVDAITRAPSTVDAEIRAPNTVDAEIRAPFPFLPSAENPQQSKALSVTPGRG